MDRTAYITHLTNRCRVPLAEAEISADAYAAAGLACGAVSDSLLDHACGHLMDGKDRTCEPSLGASCWTVAEHIMRIGAERGML